VSSNVGQCGANRSPYGALDTSNILNNIRGASRRAIGRKLGDQVSNSYIIRILESTRIRLFQDRPNRNCRHSAQLFWLVGATDDRQ
jgi:hypothetical protein